MRLIPFTIDFETTGRDSSTAHPIEVGVACPDDGAYDYERFIALPPGMTIPVETSAVHHIVDADLEGAEHWPQVLIDLVDELVLDGDFDSVLLIAHNAEYEQGILAPTQLRCRTQAQEGFPGVAWVCTYKAALRVWPDAPSHSNEGLRYWLGSQHPGRWKLGRKANNGAHSALHDAKVTAGIFNHLVEAIVCDSLRTRDEAIELMIEWTREPAQLPTCPIGKERGKKWEDVDGGFLGWCLKQPDMRPDVVHCAKKELERRAAARNAGRFMYK